MSSCLLDSIGRSLGTVPQMNDASRDSVLIDYDNATHSAHVLIDIRITYCIPWHNIFTYIPWYFPQLDSFVEFT